jgi:hypothetical protein
MKRGIAIGLLVAAVVVMSAGVALAGVSDGNYRAERQGCSGNANDTERADTAEEGCQNFTLNARDGNDNEVFRAGLPQLKDGDQPNPTNATVATPSEGFDPSTGTRLYLGADDNLNSGEHDGSDQVGDGPSDGGAVVFNVEPDSVAVWMDALVSGDASYVLTHPLPLVDAGTGACADGVCFSVQSQRRLAYDGGKRRGEPRDAANYDGYKWDPDTCSGADSGPEDCEHKKGLAYWHRQSGDVYVEPGVQVYEDPNPAGSPIGPYPLPAAYAGTCGVVAGGGPATMPASPVTNGAGQVVVPTQC